MGETSMTTDRDPATIARSIIDANSYMTLGTADERGVPWVTPVWFAPEGYREFFWVSKPGARHSRNLTARSQLAIVIFDSQTPINTGTGVYMAAEAQEVEDQAEIEHGMDVVSRRSQEQGAREWTPDDVTGAVTLRLYRATPAEQFLGVNDERISVDLG
jgi:nitroimidazol reductase NimA-like FMN-containing flavoprotein (pyridoxamine 5'-phosphate oxidase superfamily)